MKFTKTAIQILFLSILTRIYVRYPSVMNLSISPSIFMITSSTAHMSLHPLVWRELR